MMENQLWNLFRETGDPMGYLLYKAGENVKKPKQENDGKSKQKPPQDTPTASV